MSGSGVVSKEVTDEQLLDSWRDALRKWQQNVKQRPKQVHYAMVACDYICLYFIYLWISRVKVKALVRKGIPEALRGEVWQLLAGCTDNAEMLENYRVLINKVGPKRQLKKHRISIITILLFRTRAASRRSRATSTARFRRTSTSARQVVSGRRRSSRSARRTRSTTRRSGIARDSAFWLLLSSCT